MTYKSGFEYAENEAESLIQEMLQNYTQAYNDTIAEMERVYGKFLSANDPKEYYNIMIQYDRLNNLIAQIQTNYKQYAEAAGLQIQDISSMAMTNTFYRNQFMLNWFDMKGEMSFSIINPKLVEFTVTGEQALFKELARQIEDASVFLPKYGTLSSLIEKNQTMELMKIQQTITQGFIQGWSIDEVTKEFMDVFDTARYQAERIARTEFTRCANAGDYEATREAVEAGVECTRMWMATLDQATREEHQQLDGQIVGMDEPFTIGEYEAMYPGDFGDPAMDCNCRCTVVALVNGEKPEGRAGINPVTGEREVFSYKSYNEWMESNGMKRDDNGQWIPA